VLVLLKFLPRVALSRLFGALTRIRRPRWFARLSISVFHRIFARIDLSEAARGSHEDYASLQDFFTRELREGARPIAQAPLVAPCDGAFGQCGEIRTGTVLQAKGVPYLVADLLQEGHLAADLEGGAYFTIYLAPWNYHRVHHVLAGRMTASRHIPGDLWPVHKAAVEGIPKLFVRNERAWVAVRTEHGLAVAVMVGAYNVGSIRLSSCPELGRSERGIWIPPTPVPVAAGQELGIFELGSTVVLLVDKSLRHAACGADWPVLGDPVRTGTALSPAP